MHYLTFKFYIIFLKIIILHFLTHSMDLRLVKKKKQELESTSITPGIGLMIFKPHVTMRCKV